MHISRQDVWGTQGSVAIVVMMRCGSLCHKISPACIDMACRSKPSTQWTTHGLPSLPAQNSTVSNIAVSTIAPAGSPLGAPGAADGVSRQQAGQQQAAKGLEGSEADRGGGVPDRASAAAASTLASRNAIVRADKGPPPPHP